MTKSPLRIDLFSDTKTHPSKEMRKAMMVAQVGVPVVRGKYLFRTRTGTFGKIEITVGK